MECSFTSHLLAATAMMMMIPPRGSVTASVPATPAAACGATTTFSPRWNHLQWWGAPLTSPQRRSHIHPARTTTTSYGNSNRQLSVHQNTILFMLDGGGADIIVEQSLAVEVVFTSDRMNNSEEFLTFLARVDTRGRKGGVLPLGVVVVIFFGLLNSAKSELRSELGSKIDQQGAKIDRLAESMGGKFGN